MSDKKGEVKTFSAKCRTFAAAQREARLREKIERELKEKEDARKDIRK